MSDLVEMAEFIGFTWPESYHSLSEEDKAFYDAYLYREVWRALEATGTLAHCRYPKGSGWCGNCPLSPAVDPMRANYCKSSLLADFLARERRRRERERAWRDGDINDQDFKRYREISKKLYGE